MTTPAATPAPVTGAATARQPTVARGPETVAAPAKARTGVVVVYLTLAAIALAPGLALKLGYDLTGLHVALDQALGTIRAALDDIKFGSGIRFWFGVTGASMMGLLLLYPLRKVFAKNRVLGSVGAWFHIHMLFGVFGPVLILYHANFGHGGSNANVALWSMLAVAISGIVGHFVYASVSAAFYSNKQTARQQLDALITTLSEIDALHPSRQKLIDDLEAFEAELLTPRRGILASLAARLRLERRRRHIARAISWHLAHCADALHLSDDIHERLRTLIGRLFGAYVRSARQGASRSVREQIWSRWRLFHLPAFLIMIVAAVLHVVAVWDMDAPGQTDAAPIVAPAPQRAVRTAANVKAKTQEQKSTTTTTTTARPPLQAPRPVATVPVPITDPAAEPRPATRPAAPKEIVKAAPKPVVVAPPIEQSPAPKIEPPKLEAPKPVDVVQAPPTPAPAPPRVTPPKPATPSTDDPVEALRRSTADDQPAMGLGGAKPRTLFDQIAALKAKQKAGLFSHTDAETGFALTGKHTKVECASCHTEPLKEVRSTAARMCITCHKKDDVHRGRRPNCVSCHTTNRFSERLPKK